MPSCVISHGARPRTSHRRTSRPGDDRALGATVPASILLPSCSLPWFLSCGRPARPAAARPAGRCARPIRRAFEAHLDMLPAAVAASDDRLHQFVRAVGSACSASGVARACTMISSRSRRWPAIAPAPCPGAPGSSCRSACPRAPRRRRRRDLFDHLRPDRGRGVGPGAARVRRRRSGHQCVLARAVAAGGQAGQRGVDRRGDAAGRPVATWPSMRSPAVPPLAVGSAACMAGNRDPAAASAFR